MMKLEDKKWFEKKFGEIDDKIVALEKKTDSLMNDLSIKADKSLNLARAVSKKVLD